MKAKHWYQLFLFTILIMAKMMEILRLLTIITFIIKFPWDKLILVLTVSNSIVFSTFP